MLSGATEGLLVPREGSPAAAAAAAAPTAEDSLHAAAYGADEDIEGADHVLRALQAGETTGKARSCAGRDLKSLVARRFGIV